MIFRRIRRITYLACVVLAFSAIAAEAASAKPRTVKSELTRLAAAGRITATERQQRLADFNATKRAAKRLARGTTRQRELSGVVSIVEGMAARRKLNGPRLVPLWLTLDTQPAVYWTTPRRSGRPARISFPGSELVWQYYPGHGLQIQWLGTFGKLNGYWTGGKRYDARAGAAARRAAAAAPPSAPAALAWEYLFPFDGQQPPWVSSLAQGTGAAGDGARGHAAAAARPTSSRSPSARWASSRRTPPDGRARADRRRRPLPAVLRRCRTCRSSTASSSRSSGCTTSRS